MSFANKFNFEKFSNYAHLNIKTFENGLEQNQENYELLVEELTKNQAEIKNLCSSHFKNFEPDNMYNIYKTNSLTQILTEDINMSNLLYSNIINFIDLLIYCLLTCKGEEESIRDSYHRKWYFSYYYPVIFLVDIMSQFATDYIESPQKKDDFYDKVLSIPKEKKWDAFSSWDYLQSKRKDSDTITSYGTFQLQLAELISHRFFIFCSFLRKEKHLEFLEEYHIQFPQHVAGNCMLFYDIMIRIINFSNHVFNHVSEGEDFISTHIVRLWIISGAREENFYMGNVLEDLPMIPNTHKSITKTKDYLSKKNLMFTVYLWLFFVLEEEKLRDFIAAVILKNPDLEGIVRHS